MRIAYDRRTRVLMAAALAAFLLKAAMAAFTVGTNDVTTFERMLEGVNERGIEDLYRTGTPVIINGKEVGRQVMNHPPFTLHMLRVWGVLTRVSGLPLGFWMRFTCAIADLVVVWLAWRMSARVRGEWANLLLIALAPVAVFISGFHGNTDPILIAFVLAAVFLIESDSPRAAPAGVAFGIACSIKVWPLVLMPAFLLFLRPLRAKAVFSLCAGATVLVIGLPWTVTDTAVVVVNILTYPSMPGWWGLTYLVPVPWRPALATLMWASLLAAQLWMHQRIPSLYAQCGIVTALFLFLTHGFGTQYLAWLVPWLAACGWRLTVPFHIASAIYLSVLYTGWSEGRPFYADAFKYPIPFWAYRFGLLTWATLPLIVGGIYCRHAVALEPRAQAR